MGGEKDADVFSLKMSDQIAQKFFSHDGIEAERGVVEDDEFGAVGEGEEEGDADGLAFGKMFDAGLERELEAVGEFGGPLGVPGGIEGLHEGDTVILSDMSRWDNTDRIRLE